MESRKCPQSSRNSFTWRKVFFEGKQLQPLRLIITPLFRELTERKTYEELKHNCQRNPVNISREELPCALRNVCRKWKFCSKAGGRYIVTLLWNQVSRTAEEKRTTKIHRKCRHHMRQCFRDSHRAQGHDKNTPCILKCIKAITHTT